MNFTYSLSIPTYEIYDHYCIDYKNRLMHEETIKPKDHKKESVALFD